MEFLFHLSLAPAIGSIWTPCGSQTSPRPSSSRSSVSTVPSSMTTNGTPVAIAMEFQHLRHRPPSERKECRQRHRNHRQSVPGCSLRRLSTGTVSGANPVLVSTESMCRLLQALRPVGRGSSSLGASPLDDRQSTTPDGNRPLRGIRPRRRSPRGRPYVRIHQHRSRLTTDRCWW